MDKQKADKLIEEYFQKIYGFAVRKSYSSEEAEELSAVDELYDSGVFKPLTEEERVTSQLLVFSDRLPG